MQSGQRHDPVDVYIARVPWDAPIQANKKKVKKGHDIEIMHPTFQETDVLMNSIAPKASAERPWAISLQRVK